MSNLEKRLEEYTRTIEYARTLRRLISSKEIDITSGGEYYSARLVFTSKTRLTTEIRNCFQSELDAIEAKLEALSIGL